MPSILFNRFQIDARSDSIKFKKTSPLYTRPFTVVLSFAETPGTRSCNFSTV